MRARDAGACAQHECLKPGTASELRRPWRRLLVETVAFVSRPHLRADGAVTCPGEASARAARVTSGREPAWRSVCRRRL